MSASKQSIREKSLASVSSLWDMGFAFILL